MSRVKKNKNRTKGISAYILLVKNSLIVDKLNAIEWLALVIILVLIGISLYYGDNTGMFLSYFWINAGALGGKNIRFLGCNQLSYGIVQQYICELWCLPINIIHHIHWFEIGCFPVLIWFKLCMGVFFVLCLVEMVKIARILQIHEERIKWMLLLFASTILVVLPVFHIAQTDIIYAFFVLLSVRAYLQNNWVRFIVFGAMAVSCKAIAIVVIVPLILLREKRVIRIIRDCVLSVSLFIVERIWYRLVDMLNTALFGQYGGKLLDATQVNADGEKEIVKKTLDQVNVDFFSHFYHKALYFEFPAVRKGYMASVLVFLLVILCIWCYMQKHDDTLECKKKSIYVTSVAWLIFFLNASPSPYWIVSMYPVLFLMMFMNSDRIKLNMLLETVFTYTMFIVYLINTHWVYGGPSNLDYLLLHKLLPAGHDSNDGPYVARYLNNLGVESFMNIITAVCLACGLALIIVNNYRCTYSDELGQADERKTMHGFAVSQIGFLWIWFAVVAFVVSRW